MVTRWYDITWYMISVIWYDMIWYDMIWYDIQEYDMNKYCISVYALWYDPVADLWAIPSGEGDSPISRRASQTAANQHLGTRMLFWPRVFRYGLTLAVALAIALEANFGSDGVVSKWVTEPHPPKVFGDKRWSSIVHPKKSAANISSEADFHLTKKPDEMLLVVAWIKGWVCKDWAAKVPGPKGWMHLL